jgi:hypothetical protein
MNQEPDDNDDPPLKINGADEALIGVALIWAVSPGGASTRELVLVYDGDAIVSGLMARDGMDEDGAREYVETNIEGAYVGPRTPIVVWPRSLADIEEDLE